MTKLAALIAFILSVIFYFTSFNEGHFNWTSMMLVGLSCWCASEHERVP